MTHTPHLRLTPAEVKEHWEKGDYSPRGYLSHLILAHRKPGWAWRIENVSQFCRDWGFARSTFYKAKATLVAEGIIEEKIIGSIELTMISTNEQESLETGVSDQKQGVSSERQGVSSQRQTVQDQRQSQPKTLDIQEPCDSTTLNNSFTSTNTNTAAQDGVCGHDSDLENRTTFSDENRSTPDKVEKPGTENVTPSILRSAKKLGVNIDDPQLLKVAKQWPDHVENAIAALKEKVNRVKSPTRFLVRAIQEGWQPDSRQRIAPEGFTQWFNEAHDRRLAIASRQVKGILKVLMACNQWIPFSQLQFLSWDELASKFGREARYVCT